MLGFILGTMTGGAMGVFAMCLLISGKREDEALERCRMKPKEIIDHGVCICFVNSQGQELFGYRKGGEAYMKKKIIAAAVAIGVLTGFLIWKNREM